MGEGNISEEFRLKNIETKYYFIKEIDQNELISMKHKKMCTFSNFNQHLVILASAVTGCISISALASLVGIPIEIISSAVGITIYAMTATIKKSITKKTKKKHD